MTMESISFRKFKKDDINQVIRLYNETAKYNLVFERSKAFIIALTQYPGVGNEGAIIAEIGNEVVSFLILSVIKNGLILEGHVMDIVVKQKIDINHDVYVYIEKYFQEKNVDIIITAGNLAFDTLNNQDWLTIKDRVFMTYPMQLGLLLKEVMNSNGGLNEFEVIFKTEKETIHLMKNKGEVQLVEQKADIGNSTVIEASSAVLWSVMTRNSSIIKNIINGKINVSIKDIFRSIRILQGIIIPFDFDLSISDHF